MCRLGTGSIPSRQLAYVEAPGFTTSGPLFVANHVVRAGAQET
jgi:hypothetical protein